MSKFLAYISTYILMIFIGIGGVFLFTDRSSPTQAVITPSEPTAMDKLVESLSASKSIGVSGSFDIVQEGANLATIALDVDLNMLDGFDELSVKGNVNIIKGAETSKLEFVYIENKVYLSFLGAKMAVSTSDMGDLMGLISSVIKMVVPDFDLSSAIDVSSLTALLMNITEEQGENEIVLTLKTDLGDIKIITDLDYKIKSLVIPNIKLGNVELKPNLSLATLDEYQQIDEPSDANEYSNISEEITLLKAVSNSLLGDFRASGEYSGFELNAVKSGSNVDLALNYQDYALSLKYYESVGYLTFGNIKVKAGAEDINELINYFASFDSASSEIDLESIIYILLDEFKSLNLSGIDLSKITEYIFVDEANNFHIVIDGFDIEVKLVDNKVSQISTSINNQPLLLIFEYQDCSIVAPEGNYIPLSQIIEQVEAVINTLTSQSVNLKAEVEYQDYIVNIIANYSYNNGDIYFDSEISLGELKLNIAFIDSKLYFTYQGLKVKADRNTLETLLDKLPNGVDESAIKDVVLAVVDWLTSITLNASENTVILLNNQFNVLLKMQDEKISFISAKIGQAIVSANFTYNSFEKNNIDDEQYTQAEDIVELVENTISYVNNGVALKVQGEYQDLTVSGTIEYKNSTILAQLTVNYKEISADIIVVDNVVYVNALGAKIKFNFADIDKVLESLNRMGILDIENFNAMNIQINDVLSILAQSYIEYYQGTLKLTLGDLLVNVNTQNNSIVGANIQYFDANFDLQIVEHTLDLSVNSSEYLDITLLLPFIESVYNTYKLGGISGTMVLNLNYNNTVYNVDVKYAVDFANDIRAWAEFAYKDITLQLYYVNDVVYLSLQNIKIKANINDLDKVIKYATSQIGSECADMQFIVNALLNALNIDDLSFINTIVATNNSLSMQLNNSNVAIEFTDTINYLNVNLTQMSVGEVAIDGIVLEATIDKISQPISKPNGEFIDINDLLNVVDSLLNTYKNTLQGQIVVDIKHDIASALEVNQLTLPFNYEYRDGKIAFNLSTELFGSTLQLELEQDVLYLDYQGIKVCANVVDLLGYLPSASSSDDVETTIISIIKGLSLSYKNNALIGAFADPNIVMQLATNNKLVSNIMISSSIIDATVSITKAGEYKAPVRQGEYVQVSNLYQLVSNAISALSGDIYAQINANIFGLDIVGAVNYQNGTVSAQLSTKVLGKVVDIRLIENVVYINFDGLKIKFDINDTDKVLDLLYKHNLIEQGNFIKVESTAITNILKNMYLSYDGTNLQAKINYNLADFGIDLTLFDLSALGIDLQALQTNTLEVLIDGQGNALNSVSLKIDSIASIDVVLNGSALAIDNNTSGYLDIIRLLPFVDAFIDTYLSNGISGQVTLNSAELESLVGRVVVNYKVNFINGIRANLSTTLFNKLVEVDINNSQVFIKVDGVKYYIRIDEIDEIVAFINQQFGVALDSTNIDLADFSFADLKIEVLNQNELKIGYRDIALYITIDKNIQVSLDYGNVDAQVVVNKGLNTFNELQSGYLHINSLLNKISTVYNLAQKGTVNLSLSTALNGNDINVLATINFGNILNTKDINDLEVDAKVYAFDKIIDVKLINGTIYISLDGLNVKLGIDDIEGIISFINQNIVEFEMPKVDIDINTLINSIVANEQSIQVSLNGIGDLALNFVNDNLQSINFANESVNCNIELVDEFVAIELQNNYSNLVDILPVLEKGATIYKANKMSADIKLQTMLLGSLQTIEASINVDFESGLKVDLYATLEGVNIGLHLRGNTLYLDIYGLKIKLTEQDISAIVEFANKNFDARLVAPSITSGKDGEILLDFINKNFNLNLNTEFDLSKLGNFSYSETVLNWNLGNGATISLDTSKLLTINANYNDTSLYADVFAYGSAVIMAEIQSSQYVSAQEILNAVQAVVNTLQTKEYGIKADAQVYNNGALRFDAGINANLSVQNGIYFSGSARLTGESDIEVDLNYDNAYIYINYDGLKLKINKDNLLEIAGIALSVFGIDISGLGIFEDIDLDFNLENFQQIMPNIDFGNPLSLLKVINSLSYANGTFNIALNGSYITGDENSKIMNLSIVTQNEQLQSINLNQIYTSSVEYFDLQVNFSEFAGISAVEGNYIDISSASSLLRGIVNTSELKDYHISGNAKLILSLGNINWTIPYDIQVKLIEGKPQIKAVIGPMPAVAPVNNDVPYQFGDGTENGIYCGVDRTLTIYYMDGYVYFYRTEKIPLGLGGIGYRTYEKKLKVAVDQVLADPMGYVLEYGLGFSDLIMTEIEKAMELANNREQPIDLGNVLLGFGYENDYYNLTLNLEEIANNPMLGEMTVGIKTTMVESAGKEYTTNLNFNMHMPFTDSISMDLATDDMQLVDIGTPLDFTDLYNYINNYTYNEDEQWEASNGTWALSSAITYTLSFESNGGTTVASITQGANTPINVPTLSDKYVDDGDIRYIYSFAGWYTTSTFDAGTQFAQTTMPRGDTTLYAKWEYVKSIYTRTITFECNNSNGGATIAPQKFMAGSTIDLSAFVPTRDRVCVMVDDGIIIDTWGITTYTFAGWYTDADCTIAFNGIMPDKNITLYAKWNSSYTEEDYWFGATP